jgi:serine/threonine protein kinase
MTDTENENRVKDSDFSPPSPAKDADSTGLLKSGTIVDDRYRVHSLLTKGKVSAFYKVEQITTGKIYSLKTLLQTRPDEKLLVAFRKEIQSAITLSHPNLIRTHDSGNVETARPFYIMDFLQGPNLDEHSKHSGTLNLDEVLQIFIPICYALEFAHSNGILHGSVKPTSIVLDTTQSGGSHTPKLVDFKGFDAEAATVDWNAKVNPKEMLNEALYMSPEECMGKRKDHRSDIYSLGCVMFEALTGAPPFHGETALNVMSKHQSQNAPSLKEASMGIDYPLQLDEVISKALAKTPGARYQSCIELANDLLALRHPQSAGRISTSDNRLNAQETAVEGELEPTANLRFLAIIILTNFFSIALTSLLMTHFLHQDTKQEVLQSDVHDYINDLATARSMFLTETGTGANKKRVFHFPAISLGKFGYFDATKAQWIEQNAQGEVIVPLNAQTKFETDDKLIAERTNTMRLFGPNDITNLTIISTKIGRYEDNLSPIIDSTMAYVSRYTSLTQLILNGLPVTDVGVGALEDLPNLIAVDLTESRASINALRKIKNYKILTMLRIGGITGAKEAIADCLLNPNIRILGLPKSDLDDSDLAKLGKIPLHSLDLMLNPKVTDRGIKGLAQNTQLIDLELLGTSITPACTQDLASFKNLRLLKLSAVNWKKADLRTLKQVLPENCLLLVAIPSPDGLNFQRIDWEKDLP